jgi:hypothetical protein
MLDLIRTETALEEIGNRAVLELTRLNFEQIVGQREEAKTCAAEFSQCPRYFAMGPHRREFFDQLSSISLADLYPPRVGQHLHHRRTDISKGYVISGHR